MVSVQIVMHGVVRDYQYLIATSCDSAIQLITLTSVTVHAKLLTVKVNDVTP
jgi:hypothetical protein